MTTVAPPAASAVLTEMLDTLGSGAIANVGEEYEKLGRLTMRPPVTRVTVAVSVVVVAPSRRVSVSALLVSVAGSAMPQ